jgi:hypothetical protein
MAGFCTKCGSTMPSNTGFCPACGAPAGAGTAASQQGFAPVAVPVTQPIPPAPAASYPPAAAGYSQVNTGATAPVAAYPPAAGYPTEQKKSGGALKIILIVVAVVFCIILVVAGVFSYGVYRVAHSVHVDDKGNGTISMLGSTITTGKNIDISADQLGVDLYPGATRAEGGMNMTLPTGSMVSAVFVTNDPVSSVVAFYKGKLGANESDIDTDTGSVLSSGKQGANGKSGTVITIAPGTGNNNGKTQISIVHTTSTQ